MRIRRPLTEWLGLGREPARHIQHSTRFTFLGYFTRFEHQHPLQILQTGQCRSHPFPAPRVLHQQQFDRCILKDIGNCIRSIIGIERHHNQTQRECSLVEHHPLGTVAQQDRNPVAGLQVFSSQRLTPAGHGLSHLPPGQITPYFFLPIVVPIGEFIG